MSFCLCSYYPSFSFALKCLFFDTFHLTLAANLTPKQVVYYFSQRFLFSFQKPPCTVGENFGTHTKSKQICQKWQTDSVSLAPPDIQNMTAKPLLRRRRREHIINTECGKNDVYYDFHLTWSWVSGNDTRGTPLECHFGSKRFKCVLLFCCALVCEGVCLQVEHVNFYKSNQGPGLLYWGLVELCENDWSQLGRWNWA